MAISSILGSMFGGNPDEEAAPAAVAPPITPPPAAAPAEEGDNSRMLALALLGLGSTGLGALMGGREGGMLGAQVGASAGAGVLAHDAKKQADLENAKALAAKRKQERTEEIEDFKTKEDYKEKGKPIKEPETRTIDNQIMEKGPDGKWKPVYTAPAKPDKTADPIKGEDDLRKERDAHATTRRTDLLRSAYGALATSKDDAPGDMSLVYQYIKMLDPGTGVKEGEYASAENTKGIDSKILDAYNKARTGETLNPTQRGQFRSQAKAILDDQETRQMNLDTRYVSLAKSRGLNPGNVVVLAPTPSGSAGTSGGLVRMVNQKTGERLDVQAADVADAQKDGFVKE